MNLSKSKQSGFTLVEIAIVLVIIGILLAGVLKGQSMINNGRIKGLVNNMNAVSSAYNGYIDRYQKVPGTETAANANLRGWTTTANGLNPLVMGFATTFTNPAPQRAFWQVLKASGFMVGSATDIVNPPSATGGLIGAATAIYGVAGVSVCVSDVPTQIAAGVDTVIDGPIPANNIGNNIGSLQGATGVAQLPPTTLAPPGAAYNEALATNWTLCRPL
jgi:prepilin-type N-terminal cleavage/methylation domain-containing protein